MVADCLNALIIAVGTHPRMPSTVEDKLNTAHVRAPVLAQATTPEDHRALGLDVRLGVNERHPARRR